MATTRVITAQYIEYIGDKVIDKFGGSYRNYQTDGKIWRQQMPYSPAIEDFLFYQTDLFLRLLDIRDQGNFNMMYKVCFNISDHLSKYLVKKSPELNRKFVTDMVLHKIFLDSDRFKIRFRKSYRRPIDLENTKYVACNPGVIAMYKAVNSL